MTSWRDSYLIPCVAATFPASAGFLFSKGTGNPVNEQMANNRLYIHDPKTNEHILIAKSFGGWDVRTTLDDLEAFLKSVDFDSACEGTSTALVLVAEDDLPADSKQFSPYKAVYFQAEESKPEAQLGLDRFRAWLRSKI